MALSKLKIISYSDNKYSGSGIGSITVLINPASYTHNHQVSYEKTQPQGAPGTTLKFKGTPPETVSFELHFDSTGAIPGSTSPVQKQVESFKNTCFTYNGNIHEPNYLLISWGSLVFKCKLTSLNLTYTLFMSDGTPLRAKATVNFEEALDNSIIAQEANNKSPDITHMVTFKAGDTLPLLCYKIYKDPNYYIAIARYNNIVNFRNIPVGTNLYFPPIK